MKRAMMLAITLSTVGAFAADEERIKTGIGVVHSRLSDRLLERNALLEPGAFEMEGRFAPQDIPGTLGLKGTIPKLDSPVIAESFYSMINAELRKRGIHLDEFVRSHNVEMGLHPFLQVDPNQQYSEVFILAVHAALTDEGTVKLTKGTTVIRLDEWGRNQDHFVVAKDIRSRNPLVLLVVETGDGIKPVTVKLGGKVKEQLDPALISGVKALEILTQASVADIQKILKPVVKPVDADAPLVDKDMLANVEGIIKTNFNARVMVHGFIPNRPLPKFGELALGASFSFASHEDYAQYKAEEIVLKSQISTLRAQLLEKEKRGDEEFNLKKERYDGSKSLLTEVEAKLAESITKGELNTGNLEVASPSFFSFSLAMSVEKLDQLKYNAEQNTVVTDSQDLPMYVTANLHPWKSYAVDSGFGFRDLAPHLMLGLRVPFDDLEPMVGAGLGVKFRGIGLYVWGGMALQDDATPDGGSTSEWKEQYGVAIRIPHQL